MASIIGWVSSLVLLSTLLNQVWKQWKSGTSKGVSKWLFVGQSTASVGFCIYSWLKSDWVFVATNVAILVSSIIGAVIVFSRRSKEKEATA